MYLNKKHLKKSFYYSILLTLITFVLSCPYLYHYIIDKPDTPSPFNAKISSLSSNGMLIFILGQISMFVLLIFICSFVGFTWSEKYKFKGFGDLSNIRKDIKYYLIAVIPLGILLFFIFDGPMLSKLPTLYPNSPLWGLSKVFLTSTTYEIVSKFGLLTIAMGIFKNRHLAIAITSAFFAVLVRKTFLDYGVDFGFDYLSIAAVLSTFLYGVISGYLFINRGLLSVMLLRFLLDLKYFIYPIISQ